MKQAARWLMNHLPLMIMALVLAMLAWFVAVEQSDPTIERRYPQPIPVTAVDVPEDLMIVGAFDEEVYVTVRTTQSVWDTLRVSDFGAMVDLGDLDRGAYEVTVDVDVDKEPLRITDVDPARVTVQLDSRTTRGVPVRIETEGQPGVGYVAGTERVEPREVTVTGPTSYVTRVVEAFATLSIQGAQQDVEQAVAVQLRDEEGNPVPSVSAKPETVDVRIPVEPTGYHATLAVRAVLTGEVASGYRITDISIDPPTVTVFGDPDDLAALEQGFVETRPIVVDGATDDVVVRPGLSAPPTVTVVPGTEVRVRVSIEAIQSSLTITSTPEIRGLEPGYTVTVSPGAVEVILSGPLPRLQLLTADDVRIVLDLFELPVGSHQVEPEVIVPEEIIPQGVIPATVQVRISETIDLTPTPEASTKPRPRAWQL